ncbi:MAG: response regulator [Bdellovibrionaceae bacterium]|jgi:DNA-binding NtrC family response regulator|nr:response regulator [Pseudobdellovibrionaceae bacterium]
MVRILLVDDEPDILEILTGYVEEFADEVITASNGQEALALVEKQEVTVIITDISMPKMNGLDLLKTLKERGVMAPVIIVTGFGDKDAISKAWKLGAYDFLDKPIMEDKLRFVIKSALLMGYDYNQSQKSKNLGDGEKLKTVSISMDEKLYDNIIEKCKLDKVSINTVVLHAVKNQIES